MAGKLTAALEQAPQPSAQRIIKAEIERYRPMVERLLTGSYDGGADRFIESVLTAIRTDVRGDLVKCSPISIVGAALHAAQLGLEVGPLGEAYLVPRGGVCTYSPSYRGLIKLAANGGVDVDAEVVYEGDVFRASKGLTPQLHHEQRFETDKPIKWWALATRPGTTPRFVVVDRTYVDRRAKQGGPSWRSWYAEMGLKTAIRALMRITPLATRAEAREALAVAINTDGIARDIPEAIDATPDQFAGDPDDDIVEAEVVTTEPRSDP